MTESRKLSHAILVILKKYDIEINDNKLLLCLQHLPQGLTAENLPALLELKISKLINLLDTLKDDCDVKRTAGKVIGKLFDETIFNILIDNVGYFQTSLEKNLISITDKVSLCEKAALVNSTNLVNLFFDKRCNPVNYPELIMHIMCSGNNERTFQLLKEWKIDVTNSDYLFKLYAARLNNKELIDFYIQETLPISEQKITFFVQSTAIKKTDSLHNESDSAENRKPVPITNEGTNIKKI